MLKNIYYPSIYHTASATEGSLISNDSSTQASASLSAEAVSKRKINNAGGNN